MKNESNALLEEKQVRKTGAGVDPVCLKAGKAALYCGVGTKFLRTLSKNGKIPYIRLSSRCILNRLSDLDAFLDRNTVGGK